MPWMGRRHGLVGFGRSLPGEGRVDKLGCSLRGANRGRDGSDPRSNDPVALPESHLTNRCTRRRIMVILNWFEELKQRVPTGR